MSARTAKIVFDLLGDIYTYRSAAVPFCAGLAYEVQPVQPRRIEILFTSDASGADNVWVMECR